MSAPKRALRPARYTVGWMTVLACELAAAIAALDEEHGKVTIPGDPNTYVVGTIGQHHVVISCSAEAGVNPASTCATHMMRSFSNMRFCLLVGIGGGVPSAKHDVRLGDVVISRPGNAYGGVAFYDAAKMTDGGLTPTGHLNRPPDVLRNAVTYLEAQRLRGDRTFEALLAQMSANEPDMLVDDGLQDELYDASDLQTRIERPLRKSSTPEMHYGLIASGSWVIKSSGSRRADLLERVKGDVLCFEMEAAGLMNILPCLVIRGISDYCDSHKNDGWHHHASYTAASYAKWLLTAVDADDVNTAETALVATGKQGQTHPNDVRAYN